MTRAGGGADLRGWLVFGVVAVGAWEVGSRLYDQPYLLPAPSQMARELAENWELVLEGYAWITTQEVVVGFLLGSVVALLAAVLFLWLPALLEEYLYRVVDLHAQHHALRGAGLAGRGMVRARDHQQDPDHGDVHLLRGT